ncbi:MAG: hypothetical protein AAF411_09210 [Myxococcota bacterium]
MSGARVTDAVEYKQRHGKDRDAVRIVRGRRPDRLRWRSAVSKLTASAGRMRGMTRTRVEEPVREVVLDLRDGGLRQEVVIDARRYNVDLDRGEVLPFHTMGDLRRFAFLVGADVRTIQQYVALPEDFMAPVDTAACILVGRAMANHHRRRAQRTWLELPDPDGPARMRQHHRYLAERAGHDSDLASRWQTLADRLLRP